MPEAETTREQLIAENTALRQRVATLEVAEAKRMQAEETLQHTNDLLHSVSQIQSEFIVDANPKVSFDRLLQTLLTLTHSEYGFIGELRYGATDNPYLKMYAITNIAWDCDSQAFYERYAPEGLEFHNVQTLFGAVITTGEPVIANAPSMDPRGGGLPEGHPPLRAFLGLPITREGVMIGMVGIANRPGGYDQALIEFLQPVLLTCGVMVDAYRQAGRRKQAEDALRQSEHRYRHLMEHSLGLLCIHDLDGILLEVNRAAAQALGYQPQDGVGQSLRLFIAPEVRHQFDQYLERIRKQPTDSGLLRVVTRHGEERVWLYRNVRYEAPNVLPYVLGHAIDITERVQAEHALKQAHETLERRVTDRTAALQRVNTQLQAEIEERQRVETALRSREAHFGALVQHASDIIALITTDGMVRYYSPSMKKVLGYDPDEIVGRTIFGAIHPDDVPTVKHTIAQLKQHPGSTQAVEYRVRHQDGSWRTCEAIGSCPADDLSAGCVVVNARDITHRKQIEDSLRESEQRFRDLIEGSIQGIMIHRDGQPLFVNQAFADIFGYDHPQDIVATLGTADLIAPRDRARLRQMRDDRLAGQESPTHYEYQGLRKDGSPVWLESRVRMVTWQGAPAIQSTLVDISERKQAEDKRQRLEDQLRQSQKMEAVGTLAGGIAHDFNNVLGAIFINTEIAKTILPPDSPIQNHLEDVLSAAGRAKHLVQQILTFSRQVELQRQPVRLTSVIQNAMVLLRASLPTTIELRHSFPEAGDIIHADPTQLHQILLNICVNAEYAMRDTGGTLDIKVDQIEVDDAFARSCAELQPGLHVRLTVRDSGHGMTPEVRARIFDPFYTTKDVGEGTGMGLALVHGIVASHGGAITVESQPGTGSTFTLYFPCIEEPVDERPHSQDTIAQGAGCIMVVDDEPTLVSGMKALLTRLGYEVAAYTRSQEALAAFETQPERFDVVITDQTMPQLTGEQLVGDLRRLRPDIPVILCTGFSHVINATKAQQQGIDAFCMKPVDFRELGHTIERVLGHRRDVE